MSQTLNHTGLTVMRLAAQEGGCISPEVSKALGLTGHAASAQLSKMVRAGHLKKTHEKGADGYLRYSVNDAPKKKMQRASRENAPVKIAGRKFDHDAPATFHPKFKKTVSDAPSHDMRFYVDPSKPIIGGFLSAGIGRYLA